ncbi:MAG: hypothetical protein F6J93_40785, partial [Oscillatoria sp. SIO1A7]|nr:hypothetical protein [Oscillatoria sp. SIO1A7]
MKSQNLRTRTDFPAPESDSQKGRRFAIAKIACSFPTPHTLYATHPTPRVFTLWGKEKGGFHAIFFPLTEGAEILTIRGFRDFRSSRDTR